MGKKESFPGFDRATMSAFKISFGKERKEAFGLNSGLPVFLENACSIRSQSRQAWETCYSEEN